MGLVRQLGSSAGVQQVVRTNERQVVVYLPKQLFRHTNHPLVPRIPQSNKPRRRLARWIECVAPPLFTSPCEFSRQLQPIAHGGIIGTGIQVCRAAVVGFRSCWYSR